jgi:signal transduction histidine kinase/DNA-binding response OmpR family regulator
VGASIVASDVSRGATHRASGADGGAVAPGGGDAAVRRGEAGASVLVIDDTEGNRYAVSRLLRGAGMRVTEVETAAAALRRLAEVVPDLVVLDINLPDASGHDVLQIIKGMPATASVPVMHVSASFVTSADRAYGLEHGADAYLTHPLDPEVFVATVRALLRAEGERGRLYQTEHQARRAAEATAARANLLQDLTAALARTMSAAEVSQVVLTRAFKALGAVVGMLAVTTTAGQELELLGAMGIPDEIRESWRRYPITAAAPIADAVQLGTPISLETRAAMTARYPDRERDVFSRLAEPPRSLYAAPMVVDRGPAQRVLGAMVFMWGDERMVGPAEAGLIGAVADQCALALERARLYDAERAARAAAEQANAVKAQFLTTMSHELRTPLNAIGGYAQLLEMGIHGPVTPAQADALARIQRSQEHLLGLINSVLNYAKLEAGSVQYDLGDVSVIEAVRAVEALIAPQARAKGIALAVQEDDRDALVAHADGEKLRQILLNLLSNGVKFTAGGGQVIVSCARVGGRSGGKGAGGADRISITVRDTGRGIPADQLGRVFDPFVQVGRTLATPDAGTGLGLAISRDLARGMGGDLTAESVVGVGSAFTLTLPRVG